MAQEGVKGSVTIPATVKDINGSSYQVERIGEKAFLIQKLTPS